MLRITLDTNVVIEGIDGEKAAVVTHLKELVEKKRVEIALTTRVITDTDRDKDNDRREQHLREFEQYPILPTIGRFGLSLYGYDIYG